MSRATILDASWLAVETDDTPMHVANLQVFSMPPGAPQTFLRDLVASMKAACNVAPPWNLKLRYPSRIGRIVAPVWVSDHNVDLDYHVRHSALPRPGGERELGVLVSRLHSHPLDLKRPLWECHIIEGLANSRFAFYTKMHHSLIDGVSGVRLLQRTLSDSPDNVNMVAPWSVGPKRKPRGFKGDLEVPSIQGAINHALEALRKQVGSTPRLVSALGRLALEGGGKRGELGAPFVGPQSVLNHRVTGARRFATQQYELERMKKIAGVANASLNDIVLYVCGTALRRFLLEREVLPEKPLTAGIPVNIRPVDDDGTGTAISFMIANLGTDIEDPAERLEEIKESTRIAKEHLQSLPRNVLNQYTMLMMSPYILQLLTGLGGRMRPAFNITISNVPGPDHALYFNGARLEAMYPVSLIAHGGALNITCLSYNGSLNFGYTGCRETLPSMQNLAVYSGEALDDLEQRLLGKVTRPHAATRRSSRKSLRKAVPHQVKAVPSPGDE
jgi:diacylglycerol O-acyltransferase